MDNVSVPVHHRGHTAKGLLLLRLFKDPRRLSLLVLLAALVAWTPTLLSWFGSRSAAVSEPNAAGGRTYRENNPAGIRAYPAPLAAVIKPFADAREQEVTAETDATGELRSATITGSVAGDLGRLTAYYSGPGRVVPPSNVTRRFSVAIVDLGAAAEGRRAYRITVSAL